MKSGVLGRAGGGDSIKAATKYLKLDKVLTLSEALTASSEGTGVAIVYNDSKLLCNPTNGADATMGVSDISLQTYGYMFKISEKVVDGDIHYYHINCFKADNTLIAAGDPIVIYGDNLLTTVSWGNIWTAGNMSKTAEQSGDGNVYTAEEWDGRDYKYGSQWSFESDGNNGYYIKNRGRTSEPYVTNGGLMRGDGEKAAFKFYSLTTKDITGSDPQPLSDFGAFTGTPNDDGAYVNQTIGWTYASGVDMSDYKYLVLNVTRNAMNQSRSIVITDTDNNSIGDNWYTKQGGVWNGSDWAATPKPDPYKGLYFDQWNNQRIVIIDLEWLANQKKNGAEADNTAYVKTNSVKSVTINVNSEPGLYFGNAWLTNLAPTYNSDHNRTFTSEGDYGTVCLPYPAVCCGANIYQITSVTASAVKLTPVTGIMTAGQPYIFKKTAATTGDGADGVYFYRAGNSMEPTPLNDTYMKGTYKDDGKVPVNNYVLSGKLFYKVDDASNESGLTFKANRAYLKGDAVPAGARQLSVSFEEDETTGVGAALMNNEERIVNNEVYNLSGQRVAHPTKGLYIVNGKKIVIK